MDLVTVGIDLAKNVFALHGFDQHGKAVLIKPKGARGQLLEMVAQSPPCRIGREACSGAHHWARQLSRFGHTVRPMAPKFDAPYRMSGKRGKNDAAAIGEAFFRPNMRFVPVKGVDQQAILRLHRTRQGFVEDRTALYNRLRGLISDSASFCRRRGSACAGKSAPISNHSPAGPTAALAIRWFTPIG